LLKTFVTHKLWHRLDYLGEGIVSMTVLLNVNGVARRVTADPAKPLLWALREDLGMPGTKFGCGAGLCGACTVHADGEAIRSCQTSIADAAKMKITTIEAVAATPAGKRVTDSWLALDVPQCGYCQAGQIMSATALLAKNPRPDDAAIDAAMAGNICRCATYVRIRAAMKRASGEAA
jgi:isoquinoline 1-oxidoreductase alpha subunit